MGCNYTVRGHRIRNKHIVKLTGAVKSAVRQRKWMPLPPCAFLCGKVWIREPRPKNAPQRHFCPAGRRTPGTRLAAHNERRQPAKLARSCGHSPRWGEYCSRPGFTSFNRGPTLATPQLFGSTSETHRIIDTKNKRDTLLKYRVLVGAGGFEPPKH